MGSYAAYVAQQMHNLQTELAHQKALLKERDNFIVERGLWIPFVEWIETQKQKQS